jgi:hypothetical protein
VDLRGRLVIHPHEGQPARTHPVRPRARAARRRCGRSWPRLSAECGRRRRARRPGRPGRSRMTKESGADHRTRLKSRPNQHERSVALFFGRTGSSRLRYADLNRAGPLSVSRMKTEFQHGTANARATCLAGRPTPPRSGRRRGRSRGAGPRFAEARGPARPGSPHSEAVHPQHAKMRCRGDMPLR